LDEGRRGKKKIKPKKEVGWADLPGGVKKKGIKGKRGGCEQSEKQERSREAVKKKVESIFGATLGFRVKASTQERELPKTRRAISQSS